VALNTDNMSGSLRFYSEVLGFRNGGANAFWGDVAVVQGLSRDASAIMWWMVGKRPFFQFECRYPAPRATAENAVLRSAILSRAQWWR
jgi:catechol 2,3-dioxygenase-like lactoylglutathione lyase family enzyme